MPRLLPLFFAALSLVLPAAHAGASEAPEELEETDSPHSDSPAPPAPSVDLRPRNRSPFQIVPEVEIPVLLSLTAVATLPRFVATQSLSSRCGLDCDPTRIAPLDRVAIGLNVPGANAASDVIFAGAIGLPYLVNFLDVAAHRGGADGWGGYASDTLVLTETLAAAVAATNLFGFVVRRPRPYTYDPARSTSLRLHPVGQLSFFSGHSAVVVAMGVAGARLLHARHPGHPAVLVVSLGTAAAGVATAFLRPLAGQHFPTDVLAGTLAGLGIGVLVPALHERAHRQRLEDAKTASPPPPVVRLTPMVAPGSASVHLSINAW